MILRSPPYHHEEPCRRARQVYSRCGTTPEASVDDHGAMVSLGHTFGDCRPALLQNSGLTAACQADTLAKQATAVFTASNGSDRIQLLINHSWQKQLSYMARHLHVGFK